MNLAAVAPRAQSITPPPTRFARNGEVRIAYQVLEQTDGEKPLDLIVVPGLVSHLDLVWENPPQVRFYRALAQVARLILFDKRGTGLSDRDRGVPNLDQRIDDLRAVMAAAAVSKAAILGESEGGLTSLLFAATYPEEVRSLIIYGGFIHSPERHWPAHQVEARFDLLERSWGACVLPPRVAPSLAADQGFRRDWARFERMSASAKTASALLRIDRDADIDWVLPAIRVPTLLLHRTGDRRIGVENSRYLAAHLPGASYIELPGEDHLPFVGNSAQVVEEIGRFLTARSQAAAG
jgi:pimeloyl-ACP methyl ester carboxylesterase